MQSTRALKATFRHTCTVETATVTTTSDPYHPGTFNHTVDWASLAASSALIPCSWQPLTAEELADAGKAGTVIGAAHVRIMFADAPVSIQNRGALPAPEVYHRVTNVRDAQGVVDAGPLDIEKIVNVAGADKILLLEVKRVQ